MHRSEWEPSTASAWDPGSLRDLLLQDVRQRRVAPPEGETRVLCAERYELEGTLGRGGQASVFAAMDRELERPVALKVVHADSAAAAARLRNEGRLLCQLRHPSVVRAYDAGLYRGRPAVVLERLSGRSLRDLTRRGPLPWERAAPLLQGLFAAVAHVHAAGVVHRDLKLDNVMVERDGAARLIDFGLARRLSDACSMTLDGRVVGTLAYMSPERLTNQEASPASDVYALGVLAYRALSGQRPFGEGSLKDRVRGKAQLLPLDCFDIPAPLAAVVHAALACDPSERPADGRRLLHRWEAACAEAEAPKRPRVRRSRRRVPRSGRLARR
ncbi:MAG: serine/threonine-protein kinase [Planctomycetota bacterium]